VKDIIVRVSHFSPIGTYANSFFVHMLKNI
jgi:hypothetical protein